jgi:hypothetical protein
MAGILEEQAKADEDALIERTLFYLRGGRDLPEIQVVAKPFPWLFVLIGIGLIGVWTQARR